MHAKRTNAAHDNKGLLPYWLIFRACLFTCEHLLIETEISAGKTRVVFISTHSLRRKHTHMHCTRICVRVRVCVCLPFFASPHLTASLPLSLFSLPSSLIRRYTGITPTHSHSV
ncbi:hypothetical protein ATANTOWER_019107 [Ataeniobius toweri]|uniref:Uncharacterized protein n=1 Tax=Ataeniobius toweri TaxID=208326 RepID=A0ABU7AB44_9TELE|nr:hypothetical protein [Ataeniobius toweri]